MKLTTVILALLLSVSMTFGSSGCALFEQGRQQIATMSAEDFAVLEGRVKQLGKNGGELLKERLDSEQLVYLSVVLRIIMESDNVKRADILSKLLKDEEYRAVLKLAISGALDFIEARTGKRLVLSTVMSGREEKLVLALLGGVLESIEP